MLSVIIGACQNPCPCFHFFFTKYAVSFAGREGTTGPKGSPGSPGAPGFPGAQVRLLFFRLFF